MAAAQAAASLPYAIARGWHPSPAGMRARRRSCWRRRRRRRWQVVVVAVAALAQRVHCGGGKRDRHPPRRRRRHPMLLPWRQQQRRRQGLPAARRHGPAASRPMPVMLAACFWSLAARCRTRPPRPRYLRVPQPPACRRHQAAATGHRPPRRRTCCRPAGPSMTWRGWGRVWVREMTATGARHPRSRLRLGRRCRPPRRRRCVSGRQRRRGRGCAVPWMRELPARCPRRRHRLTRPPRMPP